MNNPIVFISGLGVKATIFPTYLFPHYCFQLIDLPLPDFCVDTLLVLESWVDKIAKQIPVNCVLIGWSLGGILAILLAARFPHKVKKLILLATTPRFLEGSDWPGGNEKQVKLIEEKLNQGKTIFFRYFFSLINYPNKDRIHQRFIKKHLDFSLTTDALKFYLTIFFNADLRAYYCQLTMPISFIYGERDGIINLPVRALVSLNIRSTITSIPNAGHAFFITHPHLLYSL